MGTCSECQDLEVPNCDDPSFDLDIEDGTYIVTIKDNTAQTYYTQTIEFTDGQANWDGTNTAGVFTPYNIFTITIEDQNGDPVTWLNGYDEYNCLRLTFASTTDTTPEG